MRNPLYFFLRIFAHAGDIYELIDFGVIKVKGQGFNQTKCGCTRCRCTQWLHAHSVELSPVGIALELKDIHMSSPDVSVNYIKSLLFHDICIEVVTVKQSALSLFSFLKFGFMCVCVSIFLCFFIFFPQVCDSLSLFHCCYIRCMYVCYVL